MKRCWTCKKEKPLDAFYRDRTRVDGHMGECSACRKVVYAQRRQARLECPSVVPMWKVCSACAEKKSYLDFYRSSISSDGLLSCCKKCHSEADSCTPEERRRRNLAHKYGLTPEQYAAMLLAQGGLCALCRQPETSKHASGMVKRLAVDHNAATGQVRQLLCFRCNTGIGKLRHNPQLLRAAAEYLERHDLAQAA